MENMGWMLNAILKGAVGVGERFSAAAEPQAFTEIVTSFCAVITVIAHDTSLDSDSLAWKKIFDTWADGSNDSGCFVAKNERCLESKVAIFTVHVIMN
jgi:hypothetical protein